ANGLAARKHPLQDADRLEEIELVGRGEQPAPDGPHRRGRPPARGGHRFSSPGRSLNRATVCVNEFKLAYWAKNRSSTSANRYGLVSAYFVSSNSIVSSV